MEIEDFDVLECVRARKFIPIKNKKNFGLNFSFPQKVNHAKHVKGGTALEMMIRIIMMAFSFFPNKNGYP